MPSTAVVVGSAKRYEFIDCARKGMDFDCDIFNEVEGQRIATGRYRLVPSSPFNSVDGNEYVEFDGTNIALTGGRKLELVEPPRPSNVPLTAVWSGGPGCGAFVDCSPEDDSRYLCSVFHERTGAVVVQGTYRLHGVAAGPFTAPCNAAIIGRLVSSNGGSSYLQREDGSR